MDVTNQSLGGNHDKGRQEEIVFWLSKQLLQWQQRLRRNGMLESTISRDCLQEISSIVVTATVGHAPRTNAVLSSREGLRDGREESNLLGDNHER